MLLEILFYHYSKYSLGTRVAFPECSMWNNRSPSRSSQIFIGLELVEDGTIRLSSVSGSVHEKTPPFGGVLLGQG